MQMCLDLAAEGMGKVSPNPMVGCVAVRNGVVIGSGWHKVYGGPHAEVEAVNAVADKTQIAGSEIYVSLEPCAHYGKTPPCAEMLVKLGVSKVYIGVKDPNPLVSGKGIAILEAAGIAVECGILEQACRDINRRFFTWQTEKRPYVILKWAETTDAYIGGNGLKQISGSDAQTLVHRWRSEEDAFMVGTNTLLQDNPRLNTRLWQGKDPLRVCIDFNLRSAGLNLHMYQQGQKTIILNGVKDAAEGDTLYVKINSRSPEDILAALYRMQIQSVVIEGGAELISSFLKSGLYDEIRRFKSLATTAGQGVKAPETSLQTYSETLLAQDVLMVYRK